MALKLRRGTDSERTGIVFAEGEPVYVTDTGELYIGDGSTQGGLRVSNELELDLSPSLGGNLDLNQNNIVGTGNININGNITATGEITLGDGIEDNITVGGVLASGLVPDSDGAYDLGTSGLAWRNGFFEGLNVDGEITANSLQISSIELSDSTVLFDGDTNTIFAESLVAESIEANSIEGNFVGSVFGEDSTLLVDANSSSLYTPLLEISESSITRIDDGFELQFKGKSLAVEWYDLDSALDSAPRFLWKAGRSNGDILAPVQTNDTVGAIVGTIFDGSAEVPNSAISIVIDEKTGSYDYPSKYNLALVNPEGQLFDAFTISSSGTASANVFKTGSYINESDRDTAIPNPEAGMIILLTGHDDSTGTPKFQGYDGNSWVDIN
jgi:hypothetical protein